MHKADVNGTKYLSFITVNFQVLNFPTYQKTYIETVIACE
jgi:hypothetical protein